MLKKIREELSNMKKEDKKLFKKNQVKQADWKILSE